MGQFFLTYADIVGSPFQCNFNNYFAYRICCITDVYLYSTLWCCINVLLTYKTVKQCDEGSVVL